MSLKYLEVLVAPVQSRDPEEPRKQFLPYITVSPLPAFVLKQSLLIPMFMESELCATTTCSGELLMTSPLQPQMFPKIHCQAGSPHPSAERQSSLDRYEALSAL